MATVPKAQNTVKIEAAGYRKSKIRCWHTHIAPVRRLEKRRRIGPCYGIHESRHACAAEAILRIIAITYIPWKGSMGRLHEMMWRFFDNMLLSHCSRQSAQCDDKWKSVHISYVTGCRADVVEWYEAHSGLAVGYGRERNMPRLSKLGTPVTVIVQATLHCSSQLMCSKIHNDVNKAFIVVIICAIMGQGHDIRHEKTFGHFVFALNALLARQLARLSQVQNA